MTLNLEAEMPTTELDNVRVLLEIEKVKEVQKEKERRLRIFKERSK